MILSLMLICLAPVYVNALEKLEYTQHTTENQFKTPVGVSKASVHDKLYPWLVMHPSEAAELKRRQKLKEFTQ